MRIPELIMRLVLPALTLTVVSLPTTAHAYIGPGLGLGVIGMVLALIFSVFLAVLAIVWYPIKRILRRSKNPAMTRTREESGSHPRDE
jgi:hypothetical protein